MTHQRVPRYSRAFRAALIGGVLVPTALAASPATAAPAPAPAVSCDSDRAGLAAKLSGDITAALEGHRSTTALAVQDHRTHTSCTLRPTQQVDSASVVKVTVLAALLWDAQKAKRPLTPHELELSTAMITKSDNDATTELWDQLGPAKVKGFLKAAGMTRTALDEKGAWGLTQITAHDEQRLLTLVTARNKVLDDRSRAFVLERMREVVPEQRWGVPAGAPGDATVQLKNGWLERSTHGWRVHSVGAFSGKGHDYVITVLTQDNRTMEDGIDTIQAVSRAVHKDIGPDRPAHG
ncbi:serine hydrolase [Streptomyces sp. HB132]|uniref:serine hydrolase n=1 Tax=Streptomyces sp. HB132 TaxID=767388 RepID=UPI001961C987|nr:serine hydrolase [Streptomyces sp. HB132]MBM7439042.1 beta-lactamase class A [Streptomyces sp. HB132]